MAVKKEYKIDLVITWVDPTDSNWRREKEKYEKKETEKLLNIDNSNTRYKSNPFFYFLFRGIETFIPWVNNVYLVTYGHLPSWINLSNPKLKIIKHTDFIPNHYLPTFNSNAIILNLHRIPGLSEHFIYLNDDCFFTSYTKPSYFFIHGVPVNMASEEVFTHMKYGDVYTSIILNNILLLNQAYNKRKSIFSNLFKWFNIRYPIKRNIKNLMFLSSKPISGLYLSHLPVPYTKSSFKNAWIYFEKEFDETCKRKFRTSLDCSDYLIEMSYIMEGNFKPMNRDKIGIYRNMSDKNLSHLITGQFFKNICINDYDDENVEKIEIAFKTILPNKSSFEK